MFLFSSNVDLLIVIFAHALSLGGLIGGLGFWKKMAESSIWEQIRKYVKMIGLCGASVSFGIVTFLFWKMESQPPEFFRQCISPINIGTWFLLSYMLGYDASIFRPEPKKNKVGHRHEKSALEFHIKWDLLKIELFLSIIAIAPAVALLFFSKIGIQVFEMWVAGVIGFAMGFFFWEHLKKPGIFTGTFKGHLGILSLLTTIVIGCIAVYGLYLDSSAGNPESIRILLVSITLFIECMAWYMVALCVVVFRIK